MYRNTYLELYKNTASHEQNPTVLLSHFTQIYNTLGCVLQDLEYQIGRLQLQNSKNECLKEGMGEIDHRMYQKDGRGKQNERNIIKIEESCTEEDNKKIKNLDRDGRENRSSLRKSGQTEEAVKYEEVEAKQQGSKSRYINDKLARQKETEKLSPLPIPQKVRGKVNIGLGSDSFDELFGKGKAQPKSNFKPNQLKSPIIQHQVDQNQNSQAQNTYDDFLDRIFKQTESRKSK